MKKILLQIKYHIIINLIINNTFNLQKEGPEIFKINIKIPENSFYY